MMPPSNALAAMVRLGIGRVETVKRSMNWGLQLIERLLMLFLTVTLPGAENFQLPRSFSALQLASSCLPWQVKETLISCVSSESKVAQPLNAPKATAKRATLNELTCSRLTYLLDIDRLYFLQSVLIHCRIVSKCRNLRHRHKFYDAG